MPKEPNNFEVFEDRVKSLLERWREFGRKNPTVTGSELVKACMSEIDDGFTKMLME